MCVKVGDFAILLRAGFDRWSAARMQLSTALGGVLGACFALTAQSQQGAGETPHVTTSHKIILYIHGSLPKLVLFFKN